MSTLQALDKEYGIAPVPDSVYHVVLDGASKPTATVKEGQTQQFGFGWKIKCGEYTGRYLWDFVGWFPRMVKSAMDEKAIRASRGTTIQLLKAVTISTDPENRARINEAIVGLRGATTPEEASGYLAQVANILSGTDIYLRAKTNPATKIDPATGKKVPDSTKDGFQNVQYLEKGQPIRAVCACVSDAVVV